MVWGGVLLFILGSNLGGVRPERGLRGGGRRVWCETRRRPQSGRTNLFFHTISARPSKQPLMVRTFLKVYMELGSYFLILQEQIKDIIICRNHPSWVHVGRRRTRGGQRWKRILLHLHIQLEGTVQQGSRAGQRFGCRNHPSCVHV